MGPTCEKESPPLIIPNINSDNCSGYWSPIADLEICYDNITVNNITAIQVSIKYRFTGSQPEWVGFGFKPKDLGLDCQAHSPGWNPNTATRNFTAGDDKDSDAWAEGEKVGNHPMDCTDMVIVKVRGSQFRILDHYTRDRSTPQEDEWYGGSDDLIAATGKVEDDVMFASFVKPIRSGDKFDHNIIDSEMWLLGAHGQVFGNYNPAIPAAAAGQTGSLITDFYRPLELKFHGVNRGFQSDNFLHPKSRSTKTCSFQACDGTVCYDAKWGYHGNNKDVIYFMLKSKSEWAGIAFSNDRQMIESDVVIGDNVTGVVDRYATAKSLPGEDEDQTQLGETCTNMVSDNLTVVFSRTVATSDSRDLSLDVPRYFLFAFGKLDKGEPLYHRTGRFISGQEIDATQCQLQEKPSCEVNDATETSGALTTSTSCAFMIFIAVVSLIRSYF
jgi:hypothetical protein